MTSPATSSQRSFCRMAHSSAPTWIGVPASVASRLPWANPSTIASTTSSIARPCAVDSSGAKRTSA